MDRHAGFKAGFRHMYTSKVSLYKSGKNMYVNTNLHLHEGKTQKPVKRQTNPQGMRTHLYTVR